MDMWEICIKEFCKKWLPDHWRKDSHERLREREKGPDGNNHGIEWKESWQDEC